MRTLWIAILCTVALAACASQTPAPSGWQQSSGTPPTWVSGSGSSMQRYSYVKKSFDGTLQDLASAQAAGVILHNRGAKFVKSDVFAACPGRAAVATFDLPHGQLLLEAFAVGNGQAIEVTYSRPHGTPIDTAVAAALERTLCSGVL